MAPVTAPTNETKLAVMANDIGHIKLQLVAIKNALDALTDHYVTKAEFEPVKKLVYGVVAMILVAVVAAIIALVVF